jgi:hypothetical protein
MPQYMSTCRYASSALSAGSSLTATSPRDLGASCVWAAYEQSQGALVQYIKRKRTAEAMRHAYEERQAAAEGEGAGQAEPAAPLPGEPDWGAPAWAEPRQPAGTVLCQPGLAAAIKPTL